MHRFPKVSDDGPAAILTPFGWCLAGPIGSGSELQPVARRVKSVRVLDDENVRLHDALERQWATNSLGVNSTAQSTMAIEDRAALRIMEDSI